MFGVHGTHPLRQLCPRYVKRTIVWTAWLTWIIPAWQRYASKHECVNMGGEIKDWESETEGRDCQMSAFSKERLLFLIVNIVTSRKAE